MILGTALCFQIASANMGAERHKHTARETY